MPSTTRVLGAAGVGGLLGAILFGVLTPLIYNFFFASGFYRLGDQRIPILVVFIALGSLFGAAAAAAWSVPRE